MLGGAYENVTLASEPMVARRLPTVTDNVPTAPAPAGTMPTMVVVLHVNRVNDTLPMNAEVNWQVGPRLEPARGDDLGCARKQAH